MSMPERGVLLMPPVKPPALMISVIHGSSAIWINLLSQLTPKRG